MLFILEEIEPGADRAALWPSFVERYRRDSQLIVTFFCLNGGAALLAMTAALVLAATGCDHHNLTKGGCGGCRARRKEPA